ncbi:peptide ABC transporter substrate-binding protein [Pseudarthrobacter raffinosi]|uniref:peptide ABC transporter substrate-binding protein n=1 Tax=Pseudarthrobacter raffinosi TaxID=2953651 RepID=UPI00208E9B82|nr:MULTISPECIES: ABC transporter substrate-binding protein [unclassified Pseudarthrobacter]MCO4235948.1 ABC transporter substrate-binding protein [Pseudarthrobacter sp. MDT3-28]MCO4250865.1 ABC transporter substrate-binding protein [Pseudarthrobacter sp. MDT3-9]MCO4263460.1 ABC transporter substrate-binding protein [Pseudarthrobacter sp. MDT3-26]
MRFTRTSKALGMVAIAALALTGCGAGGGSNDGASQSAGDPNKVITAYSNEPQNPLLPANTNEVYGGRVVELLFEGLRSYDADGKPVNALAESIESSDAQNWTIKVKQGQKFTNGEAITAKTFVDSWNFAANSKNLQNNGFFFESIAGYADVSAVTTEKAADGKTTTTPAPTAETMSGLTATDDSTLTVKLAQPEADWSLRLGYSAFFPLPSAALADPKTFGENPVGNGPYKFEKTGSWVHDQSISLVKNADYSGPRESKNGGVTFKFYTDPGPAYTDLQANNLDISDVLPSNALKTYVSDFQDRNATKPVATNSTLNIPGYNPNFQGEAGKLRRQALSYAINREEIAKVVFNGTRTPAKAFAPPVIDGFKEGLKGSEILKFDAAKAKDLWAQADKIQPYDNSKPLQIASNTDGGNKEWIDAVANGFKNNLGIQAEIQPFAKFAEVLNLRKSQSLPGLSRAGWQGDYPSLYNFLGPVWATGASSNYEKYSNPEFDKLLQEGLAAKTTDEANGKFNQAQEILFEDLPGLPLWDQAKPIVWSENVVKAETGWNGGILYYNITAK